MRTAFKKILRWLLPFLWRNKHNRAATIVTLGLVVVDLVCVRVVPQNFGEFLKRNQDHPLDVAMLAAGTLGVLWTSSKVIRHLKHIAFFRVINDAICVVRMQVINRLHRTTSDTSSLYDVTTVTNSTQRVSMHLRKFMNGTFLYILPYTLRALVVTASIVGSYPEMCYFPVVVLLSCYPFFRILHGFTRARLASWKANDQTLTAMVDSLSNAQFAKFHPCAESKRLRPFFSKESRYWLRSNTLKHTMHLVQVIIVGAAYTVVLLHMTLLHWQKGVAEVATLCMYVAQLPRYVYQVALRSRSLAASFADLHQVMSILSLNPTTSSKRLSLPSLWPNSQPLIKIEGVSFRFGGAKPLLRGIDFKVYSGEKIGIVGPSGGGKSTLCHLLCGYYVPIEGEVYVKGRSTRAWRMTDLGRFMHVLAQDTPILKGSICDNLMHPLVSANTLPIDYLIPRMNQSVGECGNKLSGGEKQRVLLARCLTYKPEVLILDESLSSLDEASARDLLRVVVQQVPTLIFITHRRSLLQDFHKVYLLKHGELKLLKRAAWPAQPHKLTQTA